MSGIHHINLAGIDLNLLVVFDALITERHVTRAGERIGLSQPATSNALGRLRLLFADDLFIRTAAGLQPTARAIALEQPIRQVLAQIQLAMAQDTPFDPYTSDQVFTLGMSDYGEFVVLPDLMRYLEETAPHVRILVRSTDRALALKQLDTDSIDLAIGFFPEYASWHGLQLLFQETYVCVSRHGNPHIDHPITLANYLDSPHLLVSVKEDMVGRVDAVLARQHLERRITVSVPHFLIAPFVIANTNLIATLAERVAQHYAELLSLHIQPLPLEVAGFPVAMLWHRKNNDDPAHRWLRQTIARLESINGNQHWERVG